MKLVASSNAKKYSRNTLSNFRWIVWEPNHKWDWSAGPGLDDWKKVRQENELELCNLSGPNDPVNCLYCFTVKFLWEEHVQTVSLFTVRLNITTTIIMNMNMITTTTTIIL